MRAAKPGCSNAFAFLKARLGKGCLAPCTGQDYVALSAWFHLVDLWGTADFPGSHAAERALAHVLDGMQRSVWPLAKAGIPGVLDWPHEEQLWSLVHARRAKDRAAAERHVGLTSPERGGATPPPRSTDVAAAS